MVKIVTVPEFCTNCGMVIDVRPYSKDSFHSRHQIGGAMLYWHRDCNDPTGQKLIKSQIDFHVNLWPKKEEPKAVGDEDVPSNKWGVP